MKRIIKWFALFGVVIPVLLMFTRSIELYINDKAVPYSNLYGFYLWPSSFMMLATQNAPAPNTIVILVISILANVLLYSIIGVMVGGAWKVLGKLRRSER